MAGENREIDFLTVKDGVQLRYQISMPEGGAVRGSVLLLQGRAENIEKYAEQIERLNRMGFSVFTFDWRGQGLSSRLLADRHKGYVANFDDYLDDLQAFDRQIWQQRAGNGHRYLIAHSLGGHVALRYLVERRALLDAALLVSPMFGINTAPWPHKVAELLASSAVSVGFKESYIPGSGPYVGRTFSAENVLTRDAKRFACLPDTIKENPKLALGGPTYGWLNAAFHSMKQLQTGGYTEKLNLPMRVLVGKGDSVVSTHSVEQLCKGIRGCQLVAVEGAKHEIMMETEVVQKLFWSELDRLFSLK